MIGKMTSFADLVILFSPFVSGEELSKNGKQENSFTVSLDLAGRELQCVISKDNTKLTADNWVVPISLFSAMVTTGLPLGYLMFKIKPRLPGLLPDDLPGLSGDAPNVHVLGSLVYFHVLGSLVYFHILWRKLTHFSSSL
jgi:hypothetical protein